MTRLHTLAFTSDAIVWDGVPMIDGNDMTQGATIPAQTMPQGCEVTLPDDQAVSRITVCRTHNQDMTIEVPGGDGGWYEAGRIERAPAADRPVECEFERRRIRTVRVVITRSSGEENVWGLWDLSWR